MARKDDNDDLPLPATTLAKLDRLARLMRQSGHAHGLNPVQWEALRYLSRCNALSNSPGAMALYLGSTKGTVSQTVKALAAKGFIRKQVMPQDARGIGLFLTESGQTLLTHDENLVVQADIAELSDKTRKRLDRALETLLERLRLRRHEPSFGSCSDCTYYRNAATGLAAHCMKVNATVEDAETALICVEHARR
jgi:DNA-binding MarR family transcriptional regulator